MTDVEFEDFVHTAVHDLQDKQDVLRDSFGLGSCEGYWFDQEQADEQKAWELTAIAVRHLSATGAYRAPGDGSNLFLAITVGLQQSPQSLRGRGLRC